MPLDQTQRVIFSHQGDNHRYLPHQMLGTLKFNPEGDDRIGCSVDELIAAAHALMLENPGRGEFISLYITEAAKNELGLYLHYQYGEEDHRILKTPNGQVLETYIDFFQRRLGQAYRGYEGFRNAVVSPLLPVTVKVISVEGRLHVRMKTPNDVKGRKTGHKIMIIRRPLLSRLEHTSFKCVLHDGGDLEMVSSGTEFWAHSKNRFDELDAVYIADQKFDLNKVIEAITGDGHQFEYIREQGDVYLPQISLFG